VHSRAFPWFSYQKALSSATTTVVLALEKRFYSQSKMTPHIINVSSM